jgi:hypothetical protein
MSVIEHDFGLNERLAERRFARLLELDALHEANIRANPLPYVERASASFASNKCSSRRRKPSRLRPRPKRI